MLSKVVIFAAVVMLAKGEGPKLRGPRLQRHGPIHPQHQLYLQQQQINEIHSRHSSPLPLLNPSPVTFEQPAPTQAIPSDIPHPLHLQQHAIAPEFNVYAAVPPQLRQHLEQPIHAGIPLPHAHQLQVQSGWPSTLLGELVHHNLAYADDERLGPHQYRFRYGVNDHKSGDNKQQEEAREGDNVRGRYSLLQPDGLRRVVDYSSNGHSGFNALVHYE